MHHLWLLISLLLLVTFSYDLGVLDLQATKRFALQGGAALGLLLVALKRVQKGQSSPWLPAFAVVLTWSLLPSLLRGIPAVQVLDKPLYYATLGGLWLVFSETLGPEVRPRVPALLSGLGGILGLSALLELLLLGGSPHFSGAPLVTLGNPNHLGALLVLLLPASFEYTKAQQRLGLLSSGLILMGLVLSGSHLALLGGGAALGLVAGDREILVKTRLVRILAAFVLIVSALTLRPALTSLHEVRVADESEAPVGQVGDALQGRVYLNARGLEIISSAPLLGVGSGEYPWAFALTQGEHLQANSEDMVYHTHLIHAHNDLLEVLAEEGILGFLALLVGLALVIGKRRRRGPRYAWGGLALFVFLSFGHFVLFAPQSAILGILYLALLSDPEPPHACSNPWRAAWIGASVVALVGLALGLVVYQSERSLVEGLRALERGDLEAAEIAFDDAYQAYPSGQVLFYRGTLALKKEALTQAEEDLAAAAYLLPNAEVHHNLAIVLCRRGQIDTALQRFEHALKLDPAFGPSAVAAEACAKGGEEKRR